MCIIVSCFKFSELAELPLEIGNESRFSVTGEKSCENVKPYTDPSSMRSENQRNMKMKSSPTLTRNASWRGGDELKS